MNRINRNPTKKINLVVFGGGNGASALTTAAKDLEVSLTTIITPFDDGGSTGKIKKDYHGIALGDIRQVIISSLSLSDSIKKVLNYRFGKGFLLGANVGNILIKAYFSHFKTERVALKLLQAELGMQNRVWPISFSDARLQAKLADSTLLLDQHSVASVQCTQDNGIVSLFFDKQVSICQEARDAILTADILCFAPGHFFSSILPHVFVPDFKELWQSSKARQKVWFVNLLSRVGQDDSYKLTDYLTWFEKQLGARPFDQLVVERKVLTGKLRSPSDSFEPLKVAESDRLYLEKCKVKLLAMDLVSNSKPLKKENDTVVRAPIIHDPKKLSFALQKVIRSYSYL